MGGGDAGDRKYDIMSVVRIQRCARAWLRYRRFYRIVRAHQSQRDLIHAYGNQVATVASVTLLQAVVRSWLIRKKWSNLVRTVAAAKGLHFSDDETLKYDVGDMSFTEEDSAENIVFSEEKNAYGAPLIKAASLVKMVEKITDKRYHDSFLIDAIVLSYQTFTTPQLLLRCLHMRFAAESSGVQERIRVTEVVKTWINKYPHDFDRSELSQMLEAFFAEVRSKGMDQAASDLQTLLVQTRKKQLSMQASGKQLLEHIDKIPKPILPKNVGNKGLSIEVLHETEVARQLTLIEHNIFINTRQTEFLGTAWMKKKKECHARNLLSLIARFNQVGAWVATRIVYQKRLEDRVKEIKRFLKIAEECIRLQNFASTMAIIGGMRNSAVSRLKKTWSELSSKKSKRITEIEDSMDLQHNYKKYRADIDMAKPPLMPFVAPFLADLVFIEENPEKFGRLINVHKLKLIAQIVFKLQQFQSDEYRLEPIELIQDYLLSVEPADDKALYAQSLVAEPRDSSRRDTKAKK